MHIPAPGTPIPQPHADAGPALPQRTGAPQSWMVRVADAKYYWYDPLVEIGDKPDIRDPVGRYLRRMEFELDATAARRHLFLAVSRPRVRFDIAGALHWGFFSLKLSLPLLLGAERRKDGVTVELKAPFGAKLKKPTIAMTESFLTLDWGGPVEVLSVHDLLRIYAPTVQPPGTVALVGQTHDPEARLGRGRLPAMRRLREQAGAAHDTLLLVLGIQVEVNCAEGDPAALPFNTDPLVADTLLAERVDLIEAALARHFEGGQARGRQRGERLTAVQRANQLAQYTIDLALPPACGSYHQLGSASAGAAARHLLSCFIADGQAQVASMPLPTVLKAGKS